MKVLHAHPQLGSRADHRPLATSAEREPQDTNNLDDPDVEVHISLGCSGSFATWIYPHLLDRMHQAPELVIRVTAAPHKHFDIRS
jgi:hypothetical protein